MRGLRSSVGVESVVTVCRWIDELHCLCLAFVQAWSLEWLLKFVLICKGPPFAVVVDFSFAFAAAPTAAFSFGVFSFAAFASGVCVSASGLDVLIQVVESGEKVRGEVVEVASEDVWILFFPRSDHRVKLRPALDRLAESFDFRDVGTGLHEACERIIVVDVLCDVIGEIFEILHRAEKVRVYGVDILHSRCTKELMH